jgi:hypothetical protein
MCNKSKPYRPHPYNLVGGKRCKHGVYTIEVSSENMTVTFDILVLNVLKKKGH